MTKRYQLLVVLFIISFLTGCSTKKVEEKESSPLLYSQSVVSLTDLNESDEQYIIEILGLIVPKDETEFFIKKFSFHDDGSVGYYNIEFDGISDIPKFVETNISLTETDNISFDAFSRLHPDEYYLSIFVWTKSNGEITESIYADELKSIFDNIQESNTLSQSTEY